MKFNHLFDGVLILSAGFGTRMGGIGEVLPKVLWPIGKMSLFELQYQYVRQFFDGPIYFNVHYLYKDVLNFFKTNQHKFENVVILHEPEILEIGGAIHNLAQSLAVQYQGKFLVLNCDQFLCLQEEQMEKLAQHVKNNPVALASILVPNKGYNSIVVESQKLKGIILNPPSEFLQIETYAGVCVIDLAKIPPHAGKSKFFQSVARYSQYPVAVELIQASKAAYWDFGTKERYVSSMIQLWGRNAITSSEAENLLRSQVQAEIIECPRGNKILKINCGELTCEIDSLGATELSYRHIKDHVTIELISSLRSLMASTGHTSTHK
jgi:mannose-1-phosphate guanylyltransferase